MQNNSKYPYIFIAIISVLCLLYGYPEELMRRPHGYHGWRQCDGAMMAINYYNVSMNFFEPRLSVCSGDDGKMVSEFPIVYYTAACLYKIFGPHEFFIRLISIGIFFIGLFYLFKAISLLLENEFYGLLLALMPFTSAVIIDYAFGFIPDASALGCTFIGYYFFLKFVKQNEDKSLWLSAFFFTVAGLLKITSLIGFGAIIATIVTVFVFRRKSEVITKWLHHKTALAGFIIIPLIVCGCWIAYAKYYNAVSGNGYFLTDINPLWRADSGLIRGIFSNFETQWLRAAMYRDFLHSLPFLFTLCFLLPGRKSIGLLVWLLFALFLTATYFVLFFIQFTVHDYYMICMLFLPIGICAVFLYRLKEWKGKIFNSLWLKAGVCILLLVMIYHGRRISLQRDHDIRYDEFTEYYYLEKDLDKLGITKDVRIISVGDYSSGMTLYYMNRRGWNEMGIVKPFHVKDIKSCIGKGAQYLFVRVGSENHLDEEATAMYTKNVIAEINGIKIYKL